MIAFIVIVVVIIAVSKILFTSRKGQQETYTYEKNGVLFTPAERSFLGVLQKIIDEKYYILGKVRLADLVKVKSGPNKSAWKAANNKIQSKHIDFVICDSSTFAVKFAIELDDRSHKEGKRKDRDEFVDSAMAAAGIPIHHFPVKKAYSIDEIKNSIWKPEIPEPTKVTS